MVKLCKIFIFVISMTHYNVAQHILLFIMHKKIQLKGFTFITPLFALYNTQEWFWLENKRTDNQWKIAENIYISFKNCHF